MGMPGEKYLNLGRIAHNEIESRGQVIREQRVEIARLQKRVAILDKQLEQQHANTAEAVDEIAQLQCEIQEWTNLHEERMAKASQVIEKQHAEIDRLREALKRLLVSTVQLPKCGSGLVHVDLDEIRAVRDALGGE